MTVRLSTTVRKAGEVVSNQENMKIQVHEEKYEPVVEIQRTGKLILTREEYDNLKAAFCKGKGWSLDYPHTVNVHSITLKGNYKWMPRSDVEFSIEIEE